ncbi:MAG: hypothetical protein LVQ96_05775 [Thermoplasmatales archaeon]|nr:hypothetical protein [Thermoplasmatales archaeon]MCW6170662.1 hypothetical protein [Thermoplasmatales archaeon]
MTNLPDEEPEINETILRYLYDTWSIRYRQKLFKPFSSIDDTESQTIIPWSLPIISANINVNDSYIQEIVEKQRYLQIDHEKRYGQDFDLVKLKGGRSSLPQVEDKVIRIPDEVSVNSLVNLYVYLFLVDAINKDDKLVSIEDAVFSLKNTLMIPDDFIPPQLMLNVEGEVHLDVNEMAKDIQPFPSLRLIYVYPEFVNKVPNRIRFLYPSRSYSFENQPTLTQLLSWIGDSFEKVKLHEEFSAFEESRYLKDVIYTIEVKHTRELFSPLFGPDKISKLESLGIINNSETSPAVRDEVDVNFLRLLRDTLKKKAEHLRDYWLSSTLKQLK